MNAVVAAWRRFWFEPEPTSTVAVLRISYGVLLVLWCVAIGPDLFAFFSDDGISSGMPPRRYYISLLALSPTSPMLIGLYVVLLVSAVALILGFRSRIAAVAAFVALYSLERRNPYVLNAGDRLLLMFAFYFVFAPSGVALSLDRWRRRRDDFWSFPERSPWPIRLFQIQLAILYFFTVAEKLRGETWYAGTAVGFALRIGDLLRFRVPDAVVGNLYIVNFLTWTTLAIELALAVLVWNRRLRPWVLLLGLALHIGIDLTLKVGFFSAVILVGYLSWVPPEAMSSFILSIRDRLWQRRRGESATEAAAERPVVTS